MGMQARIVMYARDRSQADAAGDAALARMQHLDRILSDYREDSEAMVVSRAAGGHPVTVSQEFCDVLGRALHFSSRSDSAFDVTIGPVTQLWRTAKAGHCLPDSQDIAAAQDLVDWRNVEFDSRRRTVRLAKHGMRLDFGGIGKGYACDQALLVLRTHGIDRALVSLAGDVRLGEPPPNAVGWSIAIADGVSESNHLLLLSNCGVSTSGDAEQVIEADERRLSHLIVPRDGFGSEARIGATVIAPDATAADALATAVAIMNPEKALPLIESTADTAARVVRLNSEGTPLEIRSSRYPNDVASPPARDES